MIFHLKYDLRMEFSLIKRNEARGSAYTSFVLYDFYRIKTSDSRTVINVRNYRSRIEYLMQNYNVIVLCLTPYKLTEKN